MNVSRLPGTAAHLRTVLANGQVVGYGNLANVERVDEAVVLTVKATGMVLAKVDFTMSPPKVQAKLAAMDKFTTQVANVFLADYGKVEIRNWREGKREWFAHGSSTVPAPRKPRTVKPVTVTVPSPINAAIDAVVTAEIAATNPAVVAAFVPKVVSTHPVVAPVTNGGIVVATETRWQDRLPKMPVVRKVTKTYSEVGGVIAKTADVGTLERAWANRAAGRVSQVIITGPAGTAKTMIAEQFAWTKDVPFLSIEGQTIQTASDWFGAWLPNGTGSFDWVETEFGAALRRGTPMVILIDEINRVESERALNGLMGLLTWQAIAKPLGAPQELRLSPGILILATLNEGVEYTGTIAVDKAVRDRFTGGVQMEYPPETVERKVLARHAPGIDPDIAKKLVTVANIQRGKSEDDSLYPSHNTISPRNLIAMANDIVNFNADPTEIIWSNVKATFLKEDFPALQLLIESQFGPDAVSSTDLPDDDDLDSYLD